MDNNSAERELKVIAVSRRKTVVLSHTATATVFNPRFLEYARARGAFAVQACNVRVPFDRNKYSVPWRLVGQQVIIRANDDEVAISLGPKQIALHLRSWSVGQDIEHPSHKKALLEHKPRAAAGALPPASPHSRRPERPTSSWLLRGPVRSIKKLSNSPCSSSCSGPSPRRAPSPR
jgi:hypothetical protein